MSMETLVFVFDYVDPLSYRLQRALQARSGAAGLPPVRRVPLELRPPPAPLLDPSGESWLGRWVPLVAALERDGVHLTPPFLVPWSRKAHELRLIAAEKGVEDEVHQAIFDGFFLDGVDLGRVDLLVRIATDAGLDFSETRVALDVDRLTEEVEGAHRELLTMGISEPPGLIWGEHRLIGTESSEDVAAFLDAAATTA